MSDPRALLGRALRSAGLDPDAPFERVPGTSAHVWVGRDVVVRVHDRPELGRLAREAAIGALLPTAALHPGVLDHGADGSVEWLVLRRVDGVQLSRAWPRMSGAERERAIRELAEALAALHAVDAPGLPSDTDMAPPHVLPLGRLVAMMQEVAVEPDLLDRSIGFVRDAWSAFDASGTGLVHGDVHLENVLWNGASTTALLDLDWTRRSWLQVDLETLLSFCDHPWLFVAEDYEDQARAEDHVRVPGWLRSSYPALFEHDRIVDRLAALGIAREFGLMHDHPPRGTWDAHDPRDRRNHVRAILEGTSHLHRWVLD